MGFLSALFGGSDSQSGSTSDTSSASQSSTGISPHQLPYLQGGWGNAQQLLGQDSSQLFSGPSQLQQLAFDQLAGGGRGGGGRGGGISDRGEGSGGGRGGSSNSGPGNVFTQAMGGMPSGLAAMKRLAAAQGGNPMAMAQQGLAGPMSMQGGAAVRRAGARLVR